MPLQEATVWDYRNTDEPRCPHCDHFHDVEKNEWWELFDDNGEREFTCPNCAKKFLVEVHCKYAFSTDDQSELEESTGEGESGE
jgi:transposase-like protein